MFYDDEVVYLLNFIFLKICFILKINYVYACMSVHGCVHINSSAFRGQKKKGNGCPGAGLAGDCEILDMDSGRQTQVLWRRKHS